MATAAYGRAPGVRVAKPRSPQPQVIHDAMVQMCQRSRQWLIRTELLEHDHPARHPGAGSGDARSRDRRPGRPLLRRSPWRENRLYRR